MGSHLDSRVASLVVFIVAIAGVITLAASQRELPFFDTLDTRRPIPYVIADGTGVPGFRPGDAALARWAIEAWARASDGVITIAAAEPETALLHLQWISPAGGLYGEMRPIIVDGRRGAVIFVMPDVRALGLAIAARAERDPLFRDTIIYLTYLHELGHGLGLAHTADFADIMYFFGHGGDIPGYFQRYRDQLSRRDDIRRVPGLSDGDVRTLRTLYPVPDLQGPAAE